VRPGDRSQLLDRGANQVGSAQLADGVGHAVVGAAAVNDVRECRERVPRDGFASVEREMTDGLDEMAPAGPGKR